MIPLTLARYVPRLRMVTTTTSPPPAGVFGENRYLDAFWFPFPRIGRPSGWKPWFMPRPRFEAHGTLVAERDLMVV